MKNNYQTFIKSHYDDNDILKTIECSYTELSIGKLISIEKNKHNFFFSKNNPNIEYHGCESNCIYIERIK